MLSIVSCTQLKSYVPVKRCRKTLRNGWIVSILPSKWPEKIFQGVANYHWNYHLWRERPNLTWRIARVSVRREPSRRPSLVDRRGNCSPEGTPVIPRERYVSYFVLKNLKRIRKVFIHTGFEFIYTGSEVISDGSHLRNYLSMLGTNCSHQIESLWWPLT